MTNSLGHKPYSKEEQEIYNLAYHRGINKGRADKYKEITSEYMLLTEKQVAEIRADAIEEIVPKAYEWLMTMDIIDCDGCEYQSECVNRNMNCFDVMTEKFLEQLKEQK